MRRVILTAFAAALTMALAAGTAQAKQGIDSFSATMSTAEAGGHPDLRTMFALDSPGQPEAAKNVIVNFPRGVFGDPNAVTQCQADEAAKFACPPDSQVGTVTVLARHLNVDDVLLGTAPVYNRVPEGSDETARLGFVVPTINVPVTIPINVRTGSDYGLRFTVSELTQTAPLASIDMNIWGFPAAKSHFTERFGAGSLTEPAGCPGLADTSCNANLTNSTLPVRPFTINPSQCSGQPLTATLHVQTYQDPANLSEATSDFPAITKCEQQVFRPVMRVRPTTSETDAPSGLDLELGTQQYLGETNAPAQIRHAVVTLPEGLTINPDAADGQSACTDAQANFGTESAAACPDNAKIGTFSLETPALAGPIPGAIYFGTPEPGDTYRMFLVADGFGIHAKLVGSVRPDPQTGRLTTVFEDLPQVPFSLFSIHLFASQRALLATPLRCTTYVVDAIFTPWNDSLAPQSSPDTFGLDSGPNGTPCPGTSRPFRPRLAAGTTNATAGTFSDFALKLDRDDGDQYLGDLNFKMPPGFTGSLRGIPYCPESAITRAANNPGLVEKLTPSCPAASQIGTSNVSSGPGTHPFHSVGKIFMAGPLKGAPLSLAAVTPALAGPYDYGTVVVRVALYVDPLTAQVKAVSDRVPQIIGGVPIRMRSIRVSLDRPNFTLNPTNCSPATVDSQGIGDENAITDFSSYFQAVNCGTLPFRPKMAVSRTGGRKGTARSANPSLRFELRTRPGDANIRSVGVILPKAFQIDQSHLGNICTEKELVANTCQGRTAIGTVKTTTPLLDQPLSGSAFAVSGTGGLPRLAFVLDGQVKLVPRADTDTVGGRLRTVVPVVPDAPVGNFRLDLFGGKIGYLANTRSLCGKRPPVVEALFTAQNGKTLTQKVRVKTGCPNAKKGKKRPK